MKGRSVIGIILNPERDHVVILKRRDVPIWVLPGGGIDPGENEEEAVIREVKEETGLKVKIRRKVGDYIPINSLTRHTHVFECDVLAGTPKSSTESLKAGFYPITKLPKDFFHIHHEMLQDALNKHPTPIQKKLTQVTYGKLFFYFIRHPLRVIRFALSQLGIPINKTN